eukprot:CAMPEP_0172644766 /NCGR_PEP_ID=MMETSP1068-20121228/239383_1 /TAXON_ID=35684 /ORGANISM="Pseudopedinella elastica, Strain CCMP716" /LENGTH=105 /DNA_ID=CAMNT_0013458979 /DNA_START=97 /DNA_END=414 /DNA_ORIENTATION=+
MNKPELSHASAGPPSYYKPQSPNLRHSGPSLPRRSADARSALDRLSIDAEKQSKSSPSASTSQARVLTANNPPSRPLRARPTLPMLSRCATGAEMRSETSAPKAR